MVVTAPPRPTEISLKDFSDWTSNVGVKKVQREWEQMAQEAKANGRDALEEFRARGFKDHHHFQKACARFNVIGWPMEFAELGSGYVLYFQFLGVLGVMLLTLFVLQIPAMAHYGAEDYSCGWHHVPQDEWQALFFPEEGQKLAWSSRPGCLANTVSIGAWYLSPGNLGPMGSTNAMVPVLYLIIVVVMCVIIFYAYQVFVLMDRRVDAATTSPADFAVMVSGLPALATDEREILNFFRKHAVKGKDDVEIVKVVIGWDAEEFREKIDRIKELRKKLSDVDPSSPEAAAHKKEIGEISKALSNPNSGGASRLKSSGVVIISFRWIDDHLKCLERWGGFWGRYFNRDAKDLLCLRGVLPGEELPRFPIAGQPVHRVEVQQAAEPGDIVWEHLAVPRWERRKRLIKTWGAMICVLMVSFFVAWMLVLAKDATSDKKEDTDGAENQVWTLLSVIPSILILTNNISIAVFAKWLGSKEFHNTHTEAEFSLALKMSWGMIANTAGVLLWCKATPRLWYTDVSLVADIFIMLLMNALVSPLVNAIDIGWKIRQRLRHTACRCCKSRLTQQKVDGWNQTLSTKGKTKEEWLAGKQEVERAVAYYKRAYEPSSMKMSRAYANALKTFVCCVLYSPLVPWVSLFGFMGITMQYWVDKYLLLRWYKRPEKPANAQMAKFSMVFVKYFAPMGLAISVFAFLTPSWEKQDLVESNASTAFALAAFFALVVPLDVSSALSMKLLGCLGYDVTGRGASEETDYYKAQHRWSKGFKYHKDQFYYKKLPESKNPDILIPGTDTSVGAEDVSAVSAVAMGSVAARAGASQGPQIRGHFMHSDTGTHGGSSGSLDADGGGGGWAEPTTYGAVAAAEAAGPPTTSATSATVVAATPAAAPAVASASPPGMIESDGEGGSPGDGGRGHKRAVWEYNWEEDEWHRFDDDCQGFIESRYQRFQGDSSKGFINVSTKGMKVSVDFDKMTTKKKGSKKIRKVRRREV